MIRHLSLLAVIFLFAACNSPKDNPVPVQPISDKIEYDMPKNVILMIGDGMGLTQITAGMYSNGNKLNLEDFPVVGLHKPYSSDNLITDSAAGATAFSCGVKTYNGAIGVDANKDPVITILEEAEFLSMATGLIATSTIVHATPASFIAHVGQRKQYEDIAAEFLETDIDLMIGGGKKYFDQRKSDNRNLYQELLGKGYRVSDYFKQDFADAQLDINSNFAFFTSNGDPLPVASGRDYLIPATERSLPFLEARGGEHGFFLMVEGSQIDWGGHANNADYIITEMIEFDQAIGKVMDYAKKNGETLVIVTADHETGGFAINPGSTMDSLITGFTTDYHTAALIPVFAYGPGAEFFSGIYENTAIHTKMRKLMQIEERLNDLQAQQ
jgi:alkaline phosphatase